MLFIKLWLVGIILSVITGIILKKKLNSVSCIIYNHRYMKGKLFQKVCYNMAHFLMYYFAKSITQQFNIN